MKNLILLADCQNFSMDFKKRNLLKRKQGLLESCAKVINSPVFSCQFCVRIVLLHTWYVYGHMISCVHRQRLILGASVILCYLLEAFYFFNLYFCLMCMNFAFMYVCAPLACFAHGGQKRGSYPLRLLPLKGQL